MPRSPWRVALSHVTCLRGFPADGSYVGAAERAVLRAGHAVRDMEPLSAGPSDAARHCVALVGDADVSVGIIGPVYGSIVPARPELSYTELEFETATRLGLPRLVFLLPTSGPLCVPGRQPAEHRVRQQEFRRRLQEEAGLLTASVETPAELDLAVYHALIELERAARGRRRSV